MPRTPTTRVGRCASARQGICRAGTDAGAVAQEGSGFFRHALRRLGARVADGAHQEGAGPDPLQLGIAAEVPAAHQAAADQDQIYWFHHDVRGST